MILIVERKIKKELKTIDRGAIMHDGWTLSGMNYIGSFVCYMRSIKTYVEGKEQLAQVPEATLMSCSPMTNVDDVEDTEETKNNISSEFNA